MKPGALLVVFVAACTNVSESSLDAGDGRILHVDRGVDLVDVARCLGCHADVRPKWERLASHALLFDCRTCHAPVDDENTGPAHAARPSCARCHSATTHHGLACVDCHDPHGSKNLFLIATTIATPDEPRVDVDFEEALGASAQGLVRTASSAASGTGLCEVCHTKTRHYRKSADAPPHDRDWCMRCHPHSEGFRAVR